MKCYYCNKACEGFVFEQGNFTVFAHRDCAVENVESCGTLMKSDCSKLN